MSAQTQGTPHGTHNVAFQDDVGSTVPTSTNMRCPDPSAHTHKTTKDSSLQDHASAAALYSTGHVKANTRDPLGPDGKLSSASAATSLKRAQAHDLPSFPIHGIDTKTSAGAAANLANTNTKSPEWWKPEQSSAAGKAALLANNYKMDPLWKPEASAAGSKAALLAHKGGANVNLWTPEASSHGFSAANIAFGKKSSTPNVARGNMDAQKKNSLLAATGAVSSSRRRRANSHPVPPPLYPDAGNSARNALSAATIAHNPSTQLYPDANNSARNALTAATMAANPSMRLAKSSTIGHSTDSASFNSPAMQAARIQHSKVSREMYTERPPVALEVEEKKRRDALQASAISMAKKMYDVQSEKASSRPSHAQSGATAAQNQKPYATEGDIKQQAMQYIGIQEAAQKLASERLAKIGVDEQEAYRSYYGYQKQGRSRLSIRRGRPRASSNPETNDSDSDDEFRSRRIRNQMSELNKSLADVDKKKQEQDRGYLLAAAQRKVQAQMMGIDKKIFDETGKMSPAMLDEWDAKARAKAAANSEARLENHGRVHIGNGKYMDQSEIDAVAQARIQPTLDEITEKTEKRRAVEEEQRLEMEESKRQTQTERERAADIKAEEKRGKEEEKRAARQEKEAEKEKRAEEKRLAKEDKRKSREVPKAIHTTTTTTDGVANAHDNDSAPDSSELTSPMSPTSPSKVKSLFSKLKRRSKHSPSTSNTTAETDKSGFIGGAALSNASSTPASPALGSPTPAGHSSAVDHTTSPAPETSRRFSDGSSISSVPSRSSRGRVPERTTDDDDDDDDDARMRSPSLVSSTESAEFEEARDGFNADLAPPLSFATADAARARASPGPGPGKGESRFREIGI